MGKIKNLIHECEHSLDIDTCFDCQYALRTAPIREEYRPSKETWYNRKTRKRRSK